MAQLIGDLLREELCQLRSVRPRRLGRISCILNDGAQFAGEILIQVGDQFLFIHCGFATPC